MIYPLIDPKEWAKTYNLRMNSRQCVNCEKQLICDIPFASGSIRGLRSKDHGCPPRYDHSVSRSIDPENKKLMDDLFILLSR